MTYFIVRDIILFLIKIFEELNSKLFVYEISVNT